MERPNDLSDIFHVSKERARDLHNRFFDWLQEQIGQEEVERWVILTYLPMYCEMRKDITKREAVMLSHVVTYSLESYHRDR